MTHCQHCGELVCSCNVDEIEEESLKDQNKTFVWEYAFESISEAGSTQFLKILPDCDD